MSANASAHVKPPSRLDSRDCWSEQAQRGGARPSLVEASRASERRASPAARRRARRPAGDRRRAATVNAPPPRRPRAGSPARTKKPASAIGTCAARPTNTAGSRTACAGSPATRRSISSCATNASGGRSAKGQAAGPPCRRPRDPQGERSREHEPRRSRGTAAAALMWTARHGARRTRADAAPALRRGLAQARPRRSPRAVADAQRRLVELDQAAEVDRRADQDEVGVRAGDRLARAPRSARRRSPSPAGRGQVAGTSRTSLRSSRPRTARVDELGGAVLPGRRARPRRTPSRRG